MSTSQNNDSDERFALGLIFALITLVVLSVLGFGAYKGVHGNKQGVASMGKGAVVGAAVLGGTATAVTPSGAVVQTTGEALVVAGTTPAGTPVVVVEEVDAARELIENGVIKFYFASAKADLAPGANEALADVLLGVKAGKRAVISGFTDATGDPEKNAELAKQRAFAVRDTLVILGVPEGKLDLQKPEAVNATGNNAEARRVEVTLAN